MSNSMSIDDLVEELKKRGVRVDAPKPKPVDGGKQPPSLSNLKPFIYLACPYSLDERGEPADADLREFRFTQATIATLRLVKEGNYVFSPITYTHPMVSVASRFYTLDDGVNLNDAAMWMTLDDFYLQRADMLAVLTLPGWEVSAGVQEEIAITKDRQKPIIFLAEEFCYELPTPTVIKGEPEEAEEEYHRKLGEVYLDSDFSDN